MANDHRQPIPARATERNTNTPSATRGTLAHTMAKASTAASRFTKRFTDTQKQAFLKAVLADGHTIAEARRMARAGQLEAPAFDIGTYAYKLVSEGRDRFEAGNDQALALATSNELKRLHRAVLAKSRGLDKTSDPAEIARVAKALAETERAMKTNTTKTPAAKPKPQATTNDKPQPTETASVVTDLLDRAAKNTAKVTRTGSLIDARNDPPSAA